MVLLDAENKPTKLYIYDRNAQNVVVDIKTVPNDLLEFIALNHGKKVDQYSHYDNADLWSRHPVLEWLKLYEVQNLAQPFVKSLKELQEKYIVPTAEAVVEILEKQGNILMPGGWLGVPGSPGHAMIYQFIKQADGTYNFVIYNTGDGIEYHQKVTKAKDKYVPLMAYHITDTTEIKKFITELLTPEIAPNLERMYKKDESSGILDESWEAKKIYNAQRVYEEIIKNKIPNAEKIEHPISAVTEREIDDIVTQGQLSGTCAMRVLMPLLKVNMGKDNFRTFHYALDLKSLQDYFETQKQKNNLGQPNNLHHPMVRRQLLQAIRRLSIRTGKLFKRYKRGNEGERVISQEKVKAVLGLLNKMDSELRRLPRAIQKSNTTARKTFSVDQFSNTAGLKMASLKKEQGVTFYHDGQSIINDQDLKTELEQKRAMEFVAPVKEAYQNKPLEFLKDYYEVVFKNDSLGYDETVLVQIENLFLSFPLKSKEELEAYFKNLSEAEAYEALTYVQMILRIYGKNCGKLNPYPSASQTITSYTALLIAKCLSNRLYLDNNEVFEKLMSQVLPNDMPLKGVAANGFDPRFDNRLVELNKINKEIKSGKEINIDEMDYYDVAFFKYRSLEDKGIDELRRQYNTLENRRIHLQEALQGKGSIVLSEKTKIEYDIFLQLKQIQYECSRIQMAHYNYFNVTNIDKANNGRSARMNMLEYEQKWWSSEPIKFRFENEEYLKSGNVLYSAQKATAIQENPLTLQDFYKIKNDYLKKTLFNTTSDPSNTTIVQHQAYMSSHKREEHISRSLPFTRQEPECSVVATKDFFESNLELLDKHDYQMFFLANMFSPGALEKQIVQNKSFVKNLRQFLEEALRYHGRDENEVSKGSLFVFQLQYFFLKYLQEHPNRQADKELQSMISWLEDQDKDLLEKIALPSTKGNKNIERELLVIYFLKIAAMQSGDEKTKITKGNLPLLLSALLKAKLTESDNLILDVELMRAAQAIKPDIKREFELLSEEERKVMLKPMLADILVSSNVLPSLPCMDNRAEYEIVCTSYPDVTVHYHNKKTNKSIVVEVDLAFAKISTQQGRLQLMLPSIYHDWNFKALFGEARLPAIRQDIGGKIFFSFEDAKGSPYRIIYDQSTRPAIHIQSRPPGETEWFEWVSKEAIYTLSERYKDEDCHWWRETNLRPPKLPTDYCSTVEKGYLLKIERDERGPSQICIDLVDGYQYLLDKEADNTNIYDVFRDFEADKHIEVWGAKDKTPAFKVKLPRYDNLSWDVTINQKGNLEFSWSENENFQLVLDHPQLIEGFLNVLYMKNKKTQEVIAIIPKQEFYVENLDKQDGEYYALKYDSENAVPEAILDNLSNRDFTFSLKKIGKIWKTTNTQKYYQFSVKNTELIAKTAEEYLQLAYLYLAKHDPDHAMWALKQCHKLGPIQGTPDEVSLIMKIMKDIPNKDHNPAHYKEAFVKDPETTAVRLYAAWLLAEQKKTSLEQMRIKTKSGAGEETLNDIYNRYVEDKIKIFYQFEFAIELNELYRDYRKVVGEIPEDMQLGYEQRLFLLSSIPAPTSTMQTELIMLKLIAAKAQKKQFIKKQNEPGYEMNEKDNKVLEALEQEIEKLSAFRKQIGIQEDIEMAPVFNAEILSGLKDTGFIDMKPPVEEKILKEESEFKEEKEGKEAQDFLKNQQERDELELKIGREKNEALQKKIASYSIEFTPEKQNMLLKNLSPRVYQAEKDLKASLEQLLILANIAISGLDATLETQLEMSASIKSKLQLNDLIWLYLQGDQTLLAQKTNIKDPEKLLNLYIKIQQYLLEYTEYQHNARMEKQLKALKTCKDSECEEVLVKLGDEASAHAWFRKMYNPDIHPEMLVFEYLEDKYIRDDQVDVIMKLLEKNKSDQKIAKDKKIGGFENIIIQLIMGFGKSKLLLPIMALKRADGTNLSIIEIPASLFGPGFSDLSEKTERLFGKKGFPLLFNRDSKCNAAILNTLYQGLLKAMRNRDYVATTPESIMSLQLKYLEMTSLENINPEQQAQIIHLENILKLMKERGDVLIDECDTALALKKELNYILGVAEPLDEYVLSNTLKIFKVLEKAEIDLGSGISCNLKQVMLREKEIQSDKKWDEIKEQLAKILIDDPDGPIHFIQFGEQCSANDREPILNYILNKTTDEPPCLKKYESSQRNRIDLVKGELSLLKICFTKKPNEFYGFPRSEDYQDSKDLAIPYFGNTEPNERAKFSTYETLLYTILLQKQKGLLSEPLISQFILDFKAAANQELLDNVQDEKLTFATTDAARKFQELTGLSLNVVIKINLSSDHILTQEEKTQFEHYLKTISGNEKSFDYILQKYILNKIKADKNILRANRINHVSQFRSASAISGTPGSLASYHERFSFDEKNSIGIDGVTIDHLIRKKPKVSFLSSKTPEGIIENAIDTKEMDNETFNRIHAFLDVGSMFEGKSNLEIAELFVNKLNAKKLEQIKLHLEPHKIKHILYFDNENRLCGLPLAGGSPILIDSTEPWVIAEKLGNFDKDGKPENRPEEYFTYYDQIHTTGIDIEQTINTIGIVSIDSQTSARDCWQGVMRLRKLANDQTIRFILPETILTQKNQGNKKVWQVEDVIELVQSNKTHQLAEIHLRAALANMDDVIREHFLNRLFSCADMTQKLALRQKYRKIFDLELDESPHAKFGTVEALTDIDKILAKHLEKCLKQFDSVESLDEVNRNALKNELNNIKSKAFKNCLKTYQYGVISSGSELEKEKEKEKEKQKEKEKERESETWGAEIRAVDYKPWLDLEQNFPEKMDWVKGQYNGQINFETLNAIIPGTFGFSENIFVSENYKNSHIQQEKITDPFIKPLNLFLVMKEPDGTFKILFITQDEFKQFYEFLSNDSNKKKLEQRSLWVVSPHNTLVCGTSDQIEIKNDKEAQEYANLLSQVQYFNADIDMLNRSQEFDWLLQGNANEKIDFLENELLGNYKEKRKYLASFKQLINQRLSLLLAQVNSAVNIAAAFEGVRNRDTSAIDRYLADLSAIKDQNLKKMVVNLGTIKEEGKNLNLLGFAIKLGHLSAVEKFIASGCVSQTYNIDNSPLLLALKYKKDAILERLLVYPNIYPPRGHKYPWSILFDKMFKLALRKGDNRLLDSFISHMRTQCDPKIIEQLVAKKIKKLAASHDSGEKIQETLAQLSRLSTDSFSDVYKPYLVRIFNTADPKKVMAILDLFYREQPHKALHEYLQQVGMEINRPEIFMSVLSDKRFAPQGNDIEYWSNLLSYHANPGSYLYVLNSKDVPTDLQSLMAIGKFPVVVEHEGKPKDFIIFKNGTLVKEFNNIDPESELHRLLQAHIRANIYGEKNEYLRNTDPLLKSLVSYGYLEFEKTSPEILEFLLKKMTNMDKDFLEILSKKLEEKGFFQEMTNMLFTGQGDSHYRHYRYEIGSLPKIYSDTLLMLSVDGRNFLIKILEAIKRHSYNFSKKDCVKKMLLLYRDLISKVDFSHPTNTDLGKFILDKIMDHRYTDPSEEKLSNLDLEFFGLLDALFDKGFSFDNYEENEMKSILLRIEVLIKGLFAFVVKWCKARFRR